MMSTSYQLLTPKLGTIIDDIDLKNISDLQFSELYSLWLKRSVLVFHNQEMDPEEFITFAKRFGHPVIHPYIAGIEGYPEILEIAKMPGETYTFGSTWHTDQMFKPEPAKATLLLAKAVPKTGGDTVFSSMASSFEGLSLQMQDFLSGLKSVCVSNNFKKTNGIAREQLYAGSASMMKKLKSKDTLDIETKHPLVCIHPETKLKTLFIGEHIQRIDGLSPKESEFLLSFLHEHSTELEYTCRVRWQSSTMVIWDNRAVQHRAIADYDEARLMHRIVIEGVKPIPSER